MNGNVLRIGAGYDARGLVEKITSYDNATAGSGNVVNQGAERVQWFWTTGRPVPGAPYHAHGGVVDTGTAPLVYNASACTTRTMRPRRELRNELRLPLLFFGLLRRG